MYQNTRQKKSAKTRSNADRTRIAALLLGDGGIGKTYLNLKLAKNPKPYAWELDHWGFWQFHTRELDISKVPSMSDLKLLCESKFSSSSPAQDRKEHQIRPSDSTGRQSPRGEEEESEIKSNNVEELSQKENKVEDEHDDIGKSTRLGPKKEQVGLDKVEVANESNASNKIWLETYCIRSKLSENIEHTLKDVFSEMSVVALCYQVSDAETLENAVHRWFPQLRYLLPTTPIVLIGCNSELRNPIQPPTDSAMPNPNPNPSYSNAQTQEGLISEARILRAAQEVNAVVALECSSRNDINIDLVLNILARVGYDYAQIKLAQSNQRQIPSVSGHKRGCIIS